MNDDYLSYNDASEFIREVGYQVVAKPNDGVGAANPFKILNKLEFTTYKLPVFEE